MMRMPRLWLPALLVVALLALGTVAACGNSNSSGTTVNSTTAAGGQLPPTARPSPSPVACSSPGVSTSPEVMTAVRETATTIGGTGVASAETTVTPPGCVPLATPGNATGTAGTSVP
jgi:hypothetical protein